MPDRSSFCLIALLLATAGTGHAQEAPVAAPVIAPADVRIIGDTIQQSLTGRPGDAASGRTLVLDRAAGNCLICHQAPEPAELYQGTIGPNLAGVGTRLDVGQLRLRMVDQSRLNPATMMPPFYRVDRLTRVAGRYRDTPVLTAAEIEDVVAYLATLKN